MLLPGRRRLAPGEHVDRNHAVTLRPGSEKTGSSKKHAAAIGHRQRTDRSEGRQSQRAKRRREDATGVENADMRRDASHSERAVGDRPRGVGLINMARAPPLIDPWPAKADIASILRGAHCMLGK